MYEPRFDAQRFRDLMLYLAYRCQDAVYFGSTKLCKLLYYSDYTAFARTGAPITGADYVRQPHGPMPREFFRQRRQLIDARLARLEMRVVLQHDEERLVPLVESAYFDGKFSDPELESIGWSLETLSGMTASEAADYSRSEVGWVIAVDGETIPYEAAYLVSEADDELNGVIDRAFADWVRRQDGDETIGRLG